MRLVRHFTLYILSGGRKQLEVTYMVGPTVEDCRRDMDSDYKRYFDLTVLVRGSIIVLVRRNLSQSAAIRV